MRFTKFKIIASLWRIFMKIITINEPKIIMSNPMSKHNYFGWPTAAKLQNGKIAVAASGFRIQHVCPFGKAVMVLSDDGGETYTLPAPIIDTPLDDRDSGILPFGENGVMVTSFNNTIKFQRDTAMRAGTRNYRLSYLDMLSEEDEKRYLGSTFRVSFDGGITFVSFIKALSPLLTVRSSSETVILYGLEEPFPPMTL